MRQPVPSDSARVRSAPASEPASGSVSANAPIPSPRASGGTKRARCSSVPNASSGSVHALVWTATVTPTPASARESSSSTRMYERKSAPAPPYSSGMQTPISPSSASFPYSSRGKRVLAVPGRRVRLDLGLREVAGERLDLALVVGQLEVHRRDYRSDGASRRPRRGCRLRPDGLRRRRSLAPERRPRLVRGRELRRQRGRRAALRRRRARRAGRFGAAARDLRRGAGVERLAPVRGPDPQPQRARRHRARDVPPREPQAKHVATAPARGPSRSCACATGRSSSGTSSRCRSSRKRSRPS